MGDRTQRVLIGGGASVFVLAVAFFTYLNARPVPPEELVRRCGAARPAWQSYQEDLKGVIGARPVASWAGRPVRAAGGGAEITFELEGEWASYDAALPILLRTPTGEVHCSAEAVRDGSERTYRFALPDTSPPSWVEVHYPHMRERLALEPDGTWRRAE